MQDSTVCQLLSKYSNLDIIDENIFQKLNIDYTRFSNLPAIPWYRENDFLYVAVYDTDNIDIKDTIEYYLQTLGFNSIKYCVGSKTQIRRYIQELCQDNQNIYTASSVITILNNALKANASDIHITPYSKTFDVMFRIDGDLSEYEKPPIESYNSIAIALKVRAKLDISENRRPQSGQFSYGSVDFRLSTHPTMYGENIVIRILNKDKQLINIKSLGFNQNDIDYLTKIAQKKQGMIIFCGATGSGKSTSIYALIELMDKRTRNIMTLEDPIEYNIINVRQTEIVPGVIDFVTGVRSILRQDPDVILIGEIRDEETAQMAIRAAMTGHLVLTTIHANDSLGAIFRLRHFHVPPSFIAENLTSIISQKLIRKKTGIGRTVVAEILKPDTHFRDLVSIEATRAELLEYATRNLGYLPLDAMNY